jgi:hypothetical protein
MAKNRMGLVHRRRRVPADLKDPHRQRDIAAPGPRKVFNLGVTRVSMTAGRESDRDRNR